MAMNTGRIPLSLAESVSEAANKAFDDGTMMQAVSPVTRELLKFWFTEPFTNRPLNFHAGQRQAILNVIYLHEVLKVNSPRDAYAQLNEGLLAENDGAVMTELGKSQYDYPKYLVKMATGTGKTWVMHALLIWQYLNAKYETGVKSGRWTKNFLFVAPGLIVYERLQDAFCGKRTDGGDTRDFNTSDIKSCEALFVPPQYRDAMFSFLQNGLIRKEEFGHKVTGDGIIAVMNWHAFLGDDDMGEGAGEGDERSDSDGKGILDDLLPAKPGVAAGNALESLDAQYLRGGRLDFLKELPDLMVVNDEAHHVYGSNANDEETIKWQRGIDLLSEGKGSAFKQLDFTATPYKTSGNGRNQREDFFPHVIVDFDLKQAILGGFVKTIVIDKRKELNDIIELDYKAVRDEQNKVVGLSDGQRVMLRAGLTKLRYLEGEFAKYGKRPKMMVVCEDTDVTPFVESFLQEEGLGADDVLRVDSNRQGEVKDAEWERIKGRLFALDRNEQPKVIVSVLMLREGFDVNNICVIVPLRATNAQILLEQTLGRGLRLMWREPEYEEVKSISRRQLLVEHTAPDAVLDMLYIIEHPAFMAFYDRFLEDGLAGAGEGEGGKGTGGGDLVTAVLKENYQPYDMFWPVILHESEDVISGEHIDAGKLKKYDVYPLVQLRRIFAQDGETFIGQEMLVKTTFGEYRVHANLFNAACYNEYLQGIVRAIFHRFVRVQGKATRAMPALQINLAEIAAIIDGYIRKDLFGEPFDPFNGSDWKILLSLNGAITEHIIKQVGELVWSFENNIETTRATVRKVWFSSIPKFVVRQNFSLELQKTIYTLTGYPSHGGGLERDFLDFVDRDSQVERFIKVNEAKHVFARIAYLRKDGLLSEYIPDFLVATKENAYLIETKAANQIQDENVQQKRMAAIEWCKRVNDLPEEDRMSRKWVYVLLSESDFYSYKNNGGTLKDMCKFAEVTEFGLKGEFDFS